MDTRSESFIETSIEYSRLCSAGLQNLIIIIFCSYGPLLSLLLQKLRGHVVHTKWWTYVLWSLIAGNVLVGRWQRNWPGSGSTRGLWANSGFCAAIRGWWPPGSPRAFWAAWYQAVVCAFGCCVPLAPNCGGLAGRGAVSLRGNACPSSGLFTCLKAPHIYVLFLLGRLSQTSYVGVDGSAWRASDFLYSCRGFNCSHFFASSQLIR